MNATDRPATPTDTSEPLRSSERPVHAALWATVVAAPVVVALVAIVREHWWPTADLAAEYLRSMDVGTGSTPLVGVYSRFGFNHPGPALFVVFAPFVRIFGPIGMYVASAVTTTVCLVGNVAVGRRVGGPRGAVLGAVASVALVAMVGPSNILDPWNPSIAVAPFLFSILCAAAVTEGHVRLLPALVATCSFIVQAHAGYALFAILLLAAPVVRLLVRDGRHAGGTISRHRFPILVSLVVAAGFWAAPLAQQLLSSRDNLSALLRGAGDPDGTTIGLGTAVRVVAAAFRPGTWTAFDWSSIGAAPEASAAWLWAPLLTAIALGVVVRDRDPRVFRFASLAGASIVTGIVSIAVLHGEVAWYLVFWLRPLVIITWGSIVLSCLTLAPPAIGSKVRPIGGAVVVVLVILCVPASMRAHADAVAPGQRTRDLADEVAPHLSHDERYLLRWSDDRPVLGMQPGFVARLEDRGFTVLLPATSRHVRVFGAGRVHGQPVRATSEMVVRGTVLPVSTIPVPEGEDVVLISESRPAGTGERVAELVIERQALIAERDLAVDDARANGATDEEILTVAAGYAPDLERNDAAYESLAEAGSAFVVTLRPVR